MRASPAGNAHPGRQNDRMTTAQKLIETLDLQQHPEGGWYRETWRGPDAKDGRAVGTAIFFLLKAGERSHWHRIDAHELWMWQSGDPLILRTATEDGGSVCETLLGRDIARGQSLQCVVEPHHWQAAEPLAGDAGFCLVSCVVTPGFEFASFELAPPDWEPH